MMKGCLTVIGAFVTAIGIVVLLAVCSGASHAPAPAMQQASAAEASAPAPAPALHPAPASRAGRHHRRHRHTPAPAAAVTDPFPFDQSLHMTAWGRFEVDEIGMTHLHGTAINNTGHDLSYAQVSIRLVDRSGAQVGTAMTNTVDLPNGARWKFDAVGSGEGVFHHGAADLTGY